jgi:hypothetical protein
MLLVHLQGVCMGNGDREAIATWGNLTLASSKVENIRSQ